MSDMRTVKIDAASWHFNQSTPQPVNRVEVLQHTSREEQKRTFRLLSTKGAGKRPATDVFGGDERKSLP